MEATHSRIEVGLVDRLDRLGFRKWVAIIVITAAAASVAAMLGVGARWPWWIVALEVATFLTIWVLPRLKWWVELLAPTWMPLLILVVAAYALFGTDQGRDLGIGLLDASQWTLALLACALFYWATGTWHAARLGLNRKFGAVRAKWSADHKMWLRWLPRLLGACAHLYATITIALAALHVALGSTWFELIYFTPSLLIVAGTYFLWWHDKHYMEARDSRDAYRRGADKGNEVEREAAEVRAEQARQQMMRAVRTLVGLGALIVALLGAAAWSGKLETGFVAATSWVLGSAALFLLLVSHRASVGEVLLRCFSAKRQEELKEAFRENRQVATSSEVHENYQVATSSKVLNRFLLGIALALIVVAWLDPLRLGNALTSMVVGFTAFGVFIVIVNSVRMMAGTSGRFAAIGAFVLLLAIGTQIVRHFHVIRLCGDPGTECTSAEGAIEARATVGEAAVAWYEQARAGVSANKPVPMLIVATAGGGIRAAYWTATILEHLERELGRDVLRKHLFAISGVSGGSVGAAMYAAAVADAPEQEAMPTQFLEQDFLAPAITTLAFVDLPATVLPDFGTINRAIALERAFEDASGGRLAGPFLELFPSKGDFSKESWRPALLLNSVHQNTGRRVITSHLKVERRVFLNAFDAHNLLGADMPASTAAHNSARFTYVSPAGRLLPRGEDGGYGRPEGFLLDGGYFENYGAITALQVLREARASINTYRAKEETKGTRLPEVQPVVLQISSDPSLRARDRARINGRSHICDPAAGYLEFEHSEPDGWFGWEERDSGGRFTALNELVAPLAGIIASRSAHGVLASEELARAICTDLQLETRPEKGESPGDEPPSPDVLTSDAPSAIENPLIAVSSESGEFNGAAAASVVTPPSFPPVYAHVAMCEGDEAKLPPDESGKDGQAIQPPLGWVLSPRMHGGFAALLGTPCGNNAELAAVVGALR